MAESSQRWLLLETVLLVCEIKVKVGEASPFLAVHRAENLSVICVIVSFHHACRVWLCPSTTSRYCFSVHRDSQEPAAKSGWALHWAGVSKLSVLQDGALAFCFSVLEGVLRVFSWPPH